jgi:ATP-dependent DNA helicase RecQ
VLEILARHDQEAAIVYCLTRADTEQVAERLKAAGVQAAAYHAGMPGMERRRIQEAFAGERLDVVVATVAFGMGIDRSDVRCVIHAAMPQSVEHFQQETGRAGRDGLEAECVLLYSAADVIRWQGLIDRKLPEGEGHDEVRAARHELVRHMQGLCSTLECRHRALSRYFGQDYPPRPCEACDVCLGEAKGMPDATVTAQKILSGVARLGQRFGVGHLVQVLRGAETDAIRRWGHDQLSTYGLMEELPQPVVTNLVYQLIDQGLLQRSSGDRPVVQLGPDAADVLRGQRAVKLLEPKAAKVRRSRADVASWEGVDRGLFDHLRQCRRRIAEERGVPAYVIFGDATLRELARIRPTTPQLLRTIHGVGERKLADPGPVFLAAITDYCREHGLGTDLLSGQVAPPARERRTRK